VAALTRSSVRASDRRRLARRCQAGSAQRVRSVATALLRRRPPAVALRALEALRRRRSRCGGSGGGGGAFAAADAAGRGSVARPARVGPDPGLRRADVPARAALWPRSLWGWYLEMSHTHTKYVLMILINGFLV